MTHSTITLSDGSETLVDEADHQWLSRWRWKPHVMGYASRSGWDARRKKWITILMHRVVAGDIPDGLVVDHINRDKRDNRRGNLRIVSQSVNNHNTGDCVRTSKAGRGAVWDQSKGKWVVRFTLDRRTHFIGRYDDVEEARRAYERARHDILGAA